MKRRFVIILLATLFSVSTGRSQDGAWIITIATGDTLAQCSLISLDSDSLRVSWSGYPVALPVESLQKLQFHRRSEFWRGAFYGSAAGALAGTFVSSAGSGSQSSVTVTSMLGAFGGFVAGGLAADYCSRDDRYDLVNCSVPEKKFIIGALLQNHLPQAEGHNPK